MSWVAVGYDANDVKYYLREDGTSVQTAEEATHFDKPGPAVTLGNWVINNSWGTNYPGEGPKPSPPQVIRFEWEEIE